MILTKDGGVKILDDESTLIPLLVNQGWVKSKEVLAEQKPASLMHRIFKGNKHG